MSRVKTVHRCQECGAGAARWAGRCGGCGAWNSLLEELDVPAAGPKARPRGRLDPAVPLAEVVADASGARPTGLPELDRVLGGGLVPGSVTLLGGEPGIGKSTLLLQMLAAVAATGARGLLVSAEESAEQVRLRAERLGAALAGVWVVSETELTALGAAVDDVAPGLLAVDSIQTVFDAELDSAPGSVAQVRHCAHRLVRLAKERDLATVLVGHVTKEGALAGPRVLEHVVDTVLSFEGDRYHALRLLRAVKHRFGATGELGVFQMGEAGLTAVPDVAALFLADRRPGVPGSAVVPALDGRRPLLVEVQALVTAKQLAVPRRSAEGVDAGRLALIAAVLHERCGVRLAERDVYALAAGGVRVVEPAADLGLALAVASAHSGVALPPDMVACGEVGLGGELRRPAQLDRRLAEAGRLGFPRAIVPTSAPDPPTGMAVVRAATLAEAVATLGLAVGPPCTPP
ncbi:MAG TPA: DNA repair protein RadA [Acidimicrobiales bacterium]|nr:DNA repair protein RadA [Acidimicrobiales bacterium]